MKLEYEMCMPFHCCPLHGKKILEGVLLQLYKTLTLTKNMKRKLKFLLSAACESKGLTFSNFSSVEHNLFSSSKNSKMLKILPENILMMLETL